MTDAEIAEFMGWSQQADRMRDNPDSLVSLVYRLVAEVRRRERQALGAQRDDLMQALKKIRAFTMSGAMVYAPMIDIHVVANQAIEKAEASA